MSRGNLDGRNFSDVLRLAREKSRMSQAEMAAKWAVSIDTWRKWEQGKYEPDFTMMGKLIRMLGEDADYIRRRMGLDLSDAMNLFTEIRTSKRSIPKAAGT